MGIKGNQIFKDEYLYQNSIDNYTEKELNQRLKAKSFKRYRRKTIKSGPITEVEMYTLFDIKNPNRGKGKKESKEAIKNQNAKNRRKHLVRLINTNFNDGDLWITLGYSPEHAPGTYKEAQKNIANYFRVLKRLAKKENIDLKYIYVTEKTRKGNYHHHIVCNFNSRDQAEEKWKYEKYPNARRIQNKGQGADGIANYISKQTKDTKNQKNYGWSRNLTQPTITWSDTVISKRKGQELATNEHALIDYFEKSKENIYKGHKYESSQVKFSDFADGAYIYTRLMASG